MAMKFFDIQLTRPTSGRATALGAVCALFLVGLLYWTQAWGFEVGLTAKVLLSVSMLWVYVTTIVGIRVTDGWRQWVLYLAGLAALNAIALLVLDILALR